MVTKTLSIELARSTHNKVTTHTLLTHAHTHKSLCMLHLSGSGEREKRSHIITEVCVCVCVCVWRWCVCPSTRAPWRPTCRPRTTGGSRPGASSARSTRWSGCWPSYRPSAWSTPGAPTAGTGPPSPGRGPPG